MRQPGQLKSISSLIKKRGTHLETLSIEASIHAQRAEKIFKVLSDDLNELVSPGNLTHGILTLFVPSASVATRLRFEELGLLKALRTEPLFSGLKRIQCRIRPIKKSIKKEVIRNRILSKTAAKTILDYSDTLSDRKLKHQFQRLAEQVLGNPESDQM